MAATHLRAGATKTLATSLVIFALGAAGVAATRPRLAATISRVKTRQDVYVLPPPEELKTATLGYRAAVADMLWATLLVEYGRHWAEKQPFPDLEKYLDAVLALDPSNPAVYRFVDTLLVFRPIRGTAADARKARAYLERGIRERPYDRDVWLQYAQFIGFLAPSFLTDEDEKERWRVEGSEAMVRAVELGADVDRAISATSLLSRSGQRAAAVEYLQRAQALTQDPATLAEIEARIAALTRDSEKGDVESPAHRRERLRREAGARYIDARWRAETPFLARSAFLLLGPMPDPAACTGNTRFERPECAPDWDAALSALGR